MENKSVEKKIERISKQQKQKLVDYMASNLEFARGQFSGIDANCTHKEQWESLRVSLNSLGGSEKTVDQWKKCWIDLKSGVKKTVNARRKFMNQTGGGSWADVPRDLNPTEEKILQIISVDAVDGDSCTPESGINLDEPFEAEYLDCDEICIPPPKKRKDTAIYPSCSTRNKLLPLESTPKSTPKYVDALDEARGMQKALVEQLTRIEKQNAEILEKLNKILGSSPSPP